MSQIILLLLNVRRAILQSHLPLTSPRTSYLNLRPYPNGLTYFEDWKLPEGSLYKPIEAVIANRARGVGENQWADTDKYAKDVVDDIISGKTGKVWRGGYATATKDATTSNVPQFVLDEGASMDTGLDQLGASEK